MVRIVQYECLFIRLYVFTFILLTYILIVVYVNLSEIFCTDFCRLGVVGCV